MDGQMNGQTDRDRDISLVLFPWRSLSNPDPQAVLQVLSRGASRWGPLRPPSDSLLRSAGGFRAALKEAPSLGPR